MDNIEEIHKYLEFLKYLSTLRKKTRLEFLIDTFVDIRIEREINKMIFIRTCTEKNIFPQIDLIALEEINEG